MFKKLYVPVDNSEYSNQAIEMALALAKPWNATIIGSHVYAAKMHDYRFKQMEYTLPEEYQDENELARQRKIHDSLITMGLQLISDSYLDVLQRRCQEAGLAYERKTFDGKHYKVLVEDIAQSDYDLVIMGALGIGAIKDSLIGSVCERVTRRVQRDVLVIKHLADPVACGETIVVGIDGSPQCFHGLKKAIELSKVFHKPIEVVSVYDPFLHYVAFNGIVDVLSEQASKVFRFKEQEQLHEEIIDTGLAKIYQSHLEVAREIAQADGVEVQLTLLPGKAFEKLLQHVRKVKPWMLILGRIGIHSQPGEMDLGSNTENLLRLAPCHVLLSSGTYVPPIDLRAEESINWSREAEERMQRVPPLVKGIARTAILRFAMERGHSVVTSDVIEQAMEAFMPGYTGRMMGKVAKVLAIEKVRDDRQLTYICAVCGYTAKTENPARCPVCQATAEHFQVIDRQVVEAIAAAEGTTLEEATFDGRKLKWSAEARRVLRDVTDAYLRRRAKARIEKVARMQKLAVITRELAVPLIEETVGSDRLESSGAQESDEAATRLTAVAPASPLPQAQPPVRSTEESKPQLNWTNADGQLNEVAAGRVAVVPPPVHSRQE
jgi:nucleotide-binding universal stress UspA family protein/predicted Zn-ribbon and HTH transcriptional regulator